MNLVLTFGMHDDHYFASQYAERYSARFAVVQPIILEGEDRASEDQFGVGEVQAATLAGDLPFGSVPSEAHSCYYTYDRAYANA